MNVSKINIKSPKYHFAILFYGIRRSIQWTHKSIRNCLLDQLPGTYDMFMHTYSLGEIHNPRASEYHIKTENRDESQQLLGEMAAFEEESQECVDKILPIKKIREYGQPWSSQKTWISLDNVSRQFHSLSKVWEIFEHYKNVHSKQYDFVIVVRPDVEFIQDVPIRSFLKYVTPTKFIVPRFHWYNGGINDRFIIATPDVASVYCNRMKYVEEFCSINGPLHPEKYLGWVMTNKAHAVAFKGNVWFRRIRAHGKSDIRDKDLHLMYKKYFLSQC